MSKKVTGRGGVERFSRCQRGEALLGFVEVDDDMVVGKEPAVFPEARVAYLREQGVQTEDLGRMT